MKLKLFLSVALAVWLPATVQAAAPDPKLLVGKWSCVTRYPEINVVSRGVGIYGADGSVRINGRFEFGYANHTFLYSVQSRGVWRLKDKLLTLTLKNDKLQRMHGNKTSRLIQQNPSIRDYDNAVFKILSGDEPTEQYFVRIDQITPTQIRQTQLESAAANAAELAKSVCTRL